MNNNIRINLTDIQNYEFENNIEKFISNSTGEYKSLVEFVKDIINNFYLVDKKINNDLLSWKFDKLLLSNNELLLNDFTLDYSNIEPVVTNILNQEFGKTVFSNSDRTKILLEIKNLFSKNIERFKNKFKEQISKLKKLSEQKQSKKIESQELKQEEPKDKNTIEVPKQEPKQEESESKDNIQIPKQEPKQEESKAKDNIQIPTQQLPRQKSQQQVNANLPNQKTTTTTNGSTTVRLVERDTSHKLSKTAIISSNLQQLLSGSFNNVFNSRTYPLFDKIYGALNENVILINTTQNFKNKSGIGRAVEFLAAAFGRKQLTKLFLNSLGDTIDFFSIIPMGRGIVKTLTYTGTLAIKVTTLLAKYSLQLTIFFGKLVYGTFKAIWQISKYIMTNFVKLVKGIIYYLNPKNLFNAFKKILTSKIGLFLSGLFTRNILEFLQHTKDIGITDFLTGEWLDKYDNYINSLDTIFDEYEYHKKTFGVLSIFLGEENANSVLSTFDFIVGFCDGSGITKETKQAIDNATNGTKTLFEHIRSISKGLIEHAPEISDIIPNAIAAIQSILKYYNEAIKLWAGLADDQSIFSVEGITAITKKAEKSVIDAINFAFNFVKLFVEQEINRMISIAPSVALGAINTLVRSTLIFFGLSLGGPLGAILFDAAFAAIGYGLYKILRNEYSNLPSFEDTTYGVEADLLKAERQLYDFFETSNSQIQSIIQNSAATAKPTVNTDKDKIGKWAAAINNSLLKIQQENKQKTDALQSQQIKNPIPNVLNYKYSDAEFSVYLDQLTGDYKILRELEDKNSSLGRLLERFFGYGIVDYDNASRKNNHAFSLKEILAKKSLIDFKNYKNDEVIKIAEELKAILSKKYEAFNSKTNLAESVYSLASGVLALPSFEKIGGNKNNITLTELLESFKTIDPNDGQQWLLNLGAFFNLTDSDGKWEIGSVSNRLTPEFVAMQQIALTRLVTLISLLNRIIAGDHDVYFDDFLKVYGETQYSDFYQNIFNTIASTDKNSYDIRNNLNLSQFSDRLESFLNLGRSSAGNFGWKLIAPVSYSVIYDDKNNRITGLGTNIVPSENFVTLTEQQQSELLERKIYSAVGFSAEEITEKILEIALEEMKLDSSKTDKELNNVNSQINEKRQKIKELSKSIDDAIEKIRTFDPANPLIQLRYQRIKSVLYPIGNEPEDSTMDSQTKQTEDRK